MDLGDDESYKAAALSEVMSLGDMEDSMEADFLADLPKDGGALAALDRLDTPPPTPIFLSELESSPLSSAGLESPLGDSELEPPGGDQDTMTMDDLLNSCGVSCDASVDSPLLSSLDLMWGASPAPAPAPSRTPTSVSAPAGSPVSAHAASPAPEAAKGTGSPAVTVRTRVLEEKSAAERPASAPLTPEQQLQAEVQRLHRQQQQEEATKRLLERQVQQLQRQQQLQQRQDQQHQQQLIKQQKQAQRHQQRQKQHLHWQQHQLQVKQQVKQHYQPQQQQQQRSQQHRLHLDDSRAGPSASTPVSAASAASAAHRAAPKVRRKTRVITIPSSSGATVTVPHIVICTPSLINSRPSASSLPVTFSVQDRQTAAARVTARPTVTYSPRDQSRPLSLGVRRRVVGRAAPGSVTVSTLAKRYSVESAPSSPETASCSMLRLHSRQKPVMKVTTATQTGEAVDEVLRNNDSTLIRLLVTGQDLTNGYKLCPDGQCLTPERQPAPPSLFAGLPDRGSSVLLSMLSHDDESQLPALFPSETAGRLLDDPL